MNKSRETTVVMDARKDDSGYDTAVKLLQAGEVVAFPTETVYGLGADATNDEAVRKIFEAKGRPADNPLIVHIADFQQLDAIVSEIPDVARICMEKFWPGPLTLILPKGPTLSKYVTANLPSVGIRMPNHPVAMRLIRQTGLPIAAPSANRSGRPSPTCAQHVWEDLKDRIPLILDGGETAVGLESTVLDCTVSPPIILRPGEITQEMLQQVIGDVSMDAGLLEEHHAPKSPGMKYTHYAPQGDMTVLEGDPKRIRTSIRELCQQMLLEQPNQRVGVLLTTNQTGDEAFCEQLDQMGVEWIIRPQGNADIQETGQHLYQWLREFDEKNVAKILAEGVPVQGFGAAVMNRMRKAAGHSIIRV